MNHLQIIQDILASATATPVAPLQMYQGEALPYVVYDVTANPENTKAVVTGLDIITLNVYIFNNDLDEAQTTANLIRQALTTQKNTGVQSAALNYFDFDYVDQINSNLILQTYNVRMAYTGNVEPLRALYTLLAEASATLTIPAFIAANYTLSGAVTATITVTKLLAGTYSLSATASAALRVGSELAGSYTLNAAASAALIVAKQFAGTYSLTASSNAALIVQKLMAGGYTLNAALSATVSAGGGFDADAQAFFDATGITDTTQKNAVNTLVTDLKGYSLWSKMKAIYPMVGGTATTHKFNLKNPADTDAAFRLLFSGGWTHAATGALPNGTNAYADTFFKPATVLTNFNTSIGVYLRTNTSKLATDIGCRDGATNRFNLAARWTNNIYYGDMNSVALGRIAPASTDSRGLFTLCRTANNVLKGYRNGTVLATTTTTETNDLPNTNLYLALVNGATDYSDREQAFSFIADGLSETENTNLYTAVQAFNTTLSRNV